MSDIISCKTAYKSKCPKALVTLISAVPPTGTTPSFGEITIPSKGLVLATCRKHKAWREMVIYYHKQDCWWSAGSTFPWSTSTIYIFMRDHGLSGYLKISMVVPCVFKVTFPDSSEVKRNKAEHKSPLNKWTLRWTKLQGKWRKGRMLALVVIYYKRIKMVVGLIQFKVAFYVTAYLSLAKKLHLASSIDVQCKLSCFGRIVWRVEDNFTV